MNAKFLSAVVAFSLGCTGLAAAQKHSPETRAFLSRWNSDELVSQGCGFPLELLDL
jgi:hypothetical protein